MFDIRVNDVWRNTDDGTRAVVKSRERKYIIVGDDFRSDSCLKKIPINSFRTFILLRRSSDTLLYSDSKCFKKTDDDFPESSVLNVKLTDQTIEVLKSFLPGYEIQIAKNAQGVLSDKELANQLNRERQNESRRN